MSAVAQAEAHLSELVERAARGETIRVTRRGKAVAKVAPLEEPKKRVDAAALRAIIRRNFQRHILGVARSDRLRAALFLRRDARP